MKAEDLGINVKTGYHDRRLTPFESRFVGILWAGHVGQVNTAPADVLAIRFFTGRSVEEAHLYLGQSFDRKTLEEWKRDIRRLQNHLLEDHDNIPVYSKSGIGGGYWIAESEEEGAAFYDTFRKRGMTGLVKASRGKQAALVDMVKQLSFEFEELVDQGGFTGHVRPRAEMPTPIEVVDAFLERMLHNPEKFADGLRKIGKKYGSVLLPREQVVAMKVKAAELQEMVASLGGYGA